MQFRFFAFGALCLTAAVSSAQLYSQQPTPNSDGGSFSDWFQMIGDDFTTSTSAPVTHIAFWGSFFTKGNPYPSGGSRTFTVRFLNDDAGEPGSEIGTETGLASFTPTSLLTTFTTDTVYRFDIDWTGPSFTPTAGTQYWLSIYDTETINNFRWHESGSGDGYDAVSPDGSFWLTETSRPNAAFELNPAPVPEPASMAALGLGALALLRRRRRS